MTAAAVSVLGLGQSIGGLSDGIFGFQEKLVALEKSQFGLKETTEDLKRAEEDYAAALVEGFKSVQDQQRAETDLLLLREKLAIETKEVKAEQEALNSEFVNFGLTAGQTGLFGLIAIKQLMPELSRAQIAATLSTANLNKVMAAGIPITAASTRAQIAATFAARGLAAGIRATFVALGPIGLAIIGVSAAWAIWETNSEAVTKALQDLWDLLTNFIPVLKGLEILVTNLFPEANAEIQEFDTTLQQSTKTITGYDLILGQTAEDTDKLNESTSRMGKTMENVPQWYKSATSSVKVYAKGVLEAQAAQDKLFREAGAAILELKKKANDIDHDLRGSGLTPGQQTLAFVARTVGFQPGNNTSETTTNPDTTRSRGAQVGGTFGGARRARGRGRLTGRNAPSAFFIGDKRRGSNIDPIRDLFKRGRGDFSPILQFRQTGIDFSREELFDIIGKRKRSITLDDARLKVLQAAQTERARVLDVANQTRLSFEEVLSMEKTGQGRVDLDNIADFNRRELASVGVV
jgi:hypothetical protein